MNEDRNLNSFLNHQIFFLIFSLLFNLKACKETILDFMWQALNGSIHNDNWPTQLLNIKVCCFFLLEFLNLNILFYF